ncbi:MAG: MATE family efflux transporter, partial [Dermatophilaceae bacterium]|nr:MATE family efflux transporter [Dermatophilaceae bacterium]
MPTFRDPRSATPTPAREIARIAVPVSMEFVLMLVLNFVNQIVVGSLGATAIAAVGFSNSLTFILGVTLGALGTSVA